jgi:hypothetical protein
MHDAVFRTRSHGPTFVRQPALSRYEVENELHYVEGIHNAAKMKPTAS